MRAAIYARVSTHDQQTLGLQVEAMTAYIKGRGWDLVRQVEDVGSGARQRPAREVLLRAARRRELEVVVVWRLDRWGRSLPDLVVTLRELTELGVGFVSLTEAVLLGNVALRVPLREDLTLCRLLWDPANLKFTNHEEANQFVRRPYREGWTL